MMVIIFIERFNVINMTVNKKVIAISLALQIFTFMVGIAKIKVLATTMTVGDYGFYNTIFPTLGLILTMVLLGSDRYIVRFGNTSDGKSIISSFYLYVLVCVIVAMIIIMFYDLQNYYDLLIYFSFFIIAQINRFYIFSQSRLVVYNWLTFAINNHWLGVLVASFFLDELPLMLTIQLSCLGMGIALCYSFFYLENAKKILLGSFNRKIFLKAFCYSIPLLPWVLSQNIMRLLDRYLIAWLLGLDSLGYYTVIVSIAGIIMTFLLVILENYRPVIFSTEGDLAQVLKLPVFFISWIGLTSIVATAFWGEEVIVLLSKSTYLQYVEILPVMVFQSFMIAWITLGSFLCEKNLDNAFIGFAYAGLVILVSILASILGYINGIWGIVSATTISYIAMLCIIGKRANLKIIIIKYDMILTGICAIILGSGSWLICDSTMDLLTKAIASIMLLGFLSWGLWKMVKA